MSNRIDPHVQVHPLLVVPYREDDALMNEDVAKSLDRYAAALRDQSASWRHLQPELHQEHPNQEMHDVQKRGRILAEVTSQFSS